MFNSSPIDSWEGAGVIYSFAGSGITDFWFWIAVICCIVPLYFALRTENHHENQHKFRSDDSDSTHGVER
ncbi:MAG: hypothetical protein OER98_04305 [Gammaproteobacteria bacterium]|nr:hypothetical protein [Gammaproteobacteria bacterium]